MRAQAVKRESKTWPLEPGAQGGGLRRGPCSPTDGATAAPRGSTGRTPALLTPRGVLGKGPAVPPTVQKGTLRLRESRYLFKISKEAKGRGGAQTRVDKLMAITTTAMANKQGES